MLRSYRMRSHGFTLIELLVVVAIIALLMAILLPSLSNAKKQAQASVCLSNLRQLGIGTQMYAQENNYIIPYPVTTISESVCWFTALDGYLGPQDRDNPNATGSLGKRNFRAFKQCPIYKTITTDSAGSVGGTQNIQQYSRTIKMNTNLRRCSANDMQARMGDIDNPVSFIAYGDGVATDIVPWNINTAETGQFSMDVTDRSLGGVATRHNGKANMVFVDGHAESLKFKTYTRMVSSKFPVDSWYAEWLLNGNEVTGQGKLNTENPNYVHNPNMPLTWSIPGKVAHYINN